MLHVFFLNKVQPSWCLKHFFSCVQSNNIVFSPQNMLGYLESKTQNTRCKYAVLLHNKLLVHFMFRWLDICLLKNEITCWFYILFFLEIWLSFIIAEGKQTVSYLPMFRWQNIPLCYEDESAEVKIFSAIFKTQTLFLIPHTKQTFRHNVTCFLLVSNILLKRNGHSYKFYKQGTIQINRYDTSTTV